MDGPLEQAIHELMGCNDQDISLPSDLLNILKTLECCIVMTDGSFGEIEDRPRLASNLLKLVLLQVRESYRVATITVCNISLFPPNFLLEIRVMIEIESNSCYLRICETFKQE